jgi:adenylate cyclase
VTPADLGAQGRLEAAFAREERRGLMLAAAARSVAVLAIIAWMSVAGFERGLAHAWVVGVASLFLVTGLAQLQMYRRRLASATWPYAFAAVDAALLGTALAVANPFESAVLPPTVIHRGPAFLYFFVLLMQATFSFRPTLVLWTGLCGALGWSGSFAWVKTRPGVYTDAPLTRDTATFLRVYFDPDYLPSWKFELELVIYLLVASGLAVLVRRSRALVAERVEVERERANLARYFSPRVVDVLAERDQPLGRVRRQAVGALFADLVGFTTLAESMSPEQVMALLRAFHGRMEDEVFRHGGCLEKFIGDALLATFGVPDPGAHDARDTLACARGMLAALAAWNRERAKAGEPPLAMGVGLHYGQVVLGDIGSARSMAFATVGDTINVASRLQTLTRDLGATIVASGDFMGALDREGVDAGLRGGLVARGARTLRGRDHPTEVWAEA